MATTIEQQVALDEALVPSTQRLRIGRSNFRFPSDIQSKESTLQLAYDVLRRCPFFKAFLVTTVVPEVYMQEFWAKAYVHQRSIRFKMNNKKHIVELESFKEMLHICPRIPGQAFEEILEFIRFLGHGAPIRTLTDININKLYQPWRSFVAIINKFLTGKSSGYDSLRLSQAQILHQNTQQYGAMLPIELTNDEIMNTKAYKEYYACATGEAAPKPKASAKRKRSAKAKSPSDPSEVARTEAQQLKIVLRRSRQQTHISQLGSYGTDKGIGSKPGVPDDGDDDEGDERGKSDDEEEDDAEDKDGDERDDDADEQEIAKIDEQDNTKRGGDDDEESESDEESDGDETREEESFDPIPRTLEDKELYSDVNINQGRGIQATLDVEDSHVTLTLVHPDGQQESSSVSSHFVTSMLNSPSDAGMESIFATVSSPVTPLQTSTPIMTLSTISIITTISHAPIPPMTIPSEVLQNLTTFESVFCFQDRLKSLEANFSEYIQTNPFAEAISNILGIVRQYMNQQMTESVNAQLEAEVLTRSSHSSRTSYAVAADLSEMELKKILIEKMEGNKFIQLLDEQRKLYKALVDAYEADKTIFDSYRETVILKRRRDDDDDDQEEGPYAGLDRGSKRQKEGKKPESASAPLEIATRSAGRSTTGSKSRHVSANESTFAEEPVLTTSQMDEPSYPKKPLTLDRDWNKTLPAVQGSTQTWISELAKQADSRSSFNELLDTPLDFSNFIMNWLRVDTLNRELLAGPTFELMKGSCTSLIELEYHLEEVYKATMDQLDWVNPEVQQYPHNLLQPLPLIPDNRGRRVIPFAHFINNDIEYLRGGASSRKYTTSVTNTKVADYGNIKWIEDLFYGFAVNWESALDVYSKRRIIAVTDLKIVEWHSYKHLDWITDVYTKHRHSATCGRSSTGSRKLPEEAQPY
nr:hypothetical protein [Tanacetum cinerariifolium]